jgi:hypothetical protein
MSRLLSGAKLEGHPEKLQTGSGGFPYPLSALTESGVPIPLQKKTLYVPHDINPAVCQAHGGGYPRR